MSGKFVERIYFRGYEREDTVMINTTIRERTILATFGMGFLWFGFIGEKLLSEAANVPWQSANWFVVSGYALSALCLVIGTCIFVVHILVITTK